MAPWNMKKGKAAFCSTKAASMAATTASSFAITTDPSNQAFLQSIEEDTKVLRAYHEDKVVDEQVALFVPYLGCSRSRDTKFLHTVEPYWHTKSFVAQTMLAKEPDCKEFRLWLDALEKQNRLLLTWVSWFVKKHGGAIHLTPEGTSGASQDNLPVVMGNEQPLARIQVPPA